MVRAVALTLTLSQGEREPFLPLPLGEGRGEGINNQALQYFLRITTTIVPTSPATSRNSGRIIRKVIT